MTRLTIRLADLAAVRFELAHFRRDCPTRQTTIKRRKKAKEKRGRKRDVRCSTCSLSRRSCVMFWKNGIEYRGEVPATGDSTRCDVARARPWVTDSSPVMATTQRSAARAKAQLEVNTRIPRFPRNHVQRQAVRTHTRTHGTETKEKESGAGKACDVVVCVRGRGEEWAYGVRTFADINDERVWTRRHVDQFPCQVLDLQAGVIRRLQQLSSRNAVRQYGPMGTPCVQCVPPGRGERTYEG